MPRVRSIALASIIATATLYGVSMAYMIYRGMH